MKSILALLVACSCLGFAQAEQSVVTWYVDAAAAAGGHGLTPDAAFNRIMTAVDAASDGDTVLIAAGTYRECVEIDSKFIHFKGAGRDKTVIDAEGKGRALTLYGAPIGGFRIEGVTLANGRAETGAGLYVSDWLAQTTFIDGSIVDCISTGEGAAVFGNDKTWIVRSLIGRSWSTTDGCSAISSVKGLFSSVIINCGRGLDSNWTADMKVSPVLGTPSTLVINCTFCANEGTVAKYTDVTQYGTYRIRNCAFLNLRSFWTRQALGAWYCFGSVGGIWANNHNNIGGDDPKKYPNEKWATKQMQLMNPFGDWRIMPGADLLEAGNKEYLADVPEEFREKDFYGKQRLQGAQVDIGAAEGAATLTSGTLFFPCSGVTPATTNLWVNGFRVTALENQMTSGNPSIGNGLCFATDEGHRQVVIEFRSPAPESIDIFGIETTYLNNTGKNNMYVFPDQKNRMTITIPQAGTAINCTIVSAAGVRYVDPVNGNDGNDGSKNLPWHTLQKAADATPANCVINAMPGTYAEGGALGTSDGDNICSTSNRVYVSKHLRFFGVAGAEKTIIKGVRSTANSDPAYDGCGKGAMRCVQALPGYNVCFTGFTATGGAVDSDPVGQQKTGKNGDSILRNNFGGGGIQEVTYAGNPSGVHRLQVIDCIVSNNVAYWGAAGYWTTFKGCLITDNRLVNKDNVKTTGITDTRGSAGINCVYASSVLWKNPITVGNKELSYGSYYFDSVMVETSGTSLSVGGSSRNCAIAGVSGPSDLDGNINIGANHGAVADFDGGDFRPTPGSPLLTKAWTALTQFPLYYAFVTSSRDGIAYEVGSGRSLVSGAYREAFTGVTGHDWYVNAATGKDTNDGRSASKPKKTLAAVMAVVSAGDTVHAASGTYNEGEMTNTFHAISARSATSFQGSRVVIPSGVTLVSENGPANTIIEGRWATGATALGAGCAGASGLRCVYMGNGAKLIGFTLSKGVGNGLGSVADDNCGGGVLAPPPDSGSGTAYISNCIFENCVARSGAAVIGGVVDHCVMRNCYPHSDGVTYYSRLDNCLIYACERGVLRAHYGAKNCTFIIDGESADPDFVPAGGGPWYIDNSVVYSKKDTSSTYPITLKYARNCIYRTFTYMKYDAATCPNIITTDADYSTFLDAATYRPLKGGIAIDAGNNSLVGADDTTLDFGTRIFNGAVDIGCYEYNPIAEFSEGLTGGRRNPTLTEISGETVGNGDGSITIHRGETVVHCEWAGLGNGETCQMHVNVVGEGLLFVIDDKGNEIGRYSKNDGPVVVVGRRPDGSMATDIHFVYQIDASQTDDPGVVLSNFSHEGGFLIIYR